MGLGWGLGWTWRGWRREVRVGIRGVEIGMAWGWYGFGGVGGGGVGVIEVPVGVGGVGLACYGVPELCLLRVPTTPTKY